MLPARTPIATPPPITAMKSTSARLRPVCRCAPGRAGRRLSTRFLSAALAGLRETGAMTGGADRPGFVDCFGCSSTKSSSSGESGAAAGGGGGGGGGGGRESTKSKLTSAASDDGTACPNGSCSGVSFGARSVSSIAFLGVSAVSSETGNTSPEPDEGPNAESNSSCFAGRKSVTVFADAVSSSSPGSEGACICAAAGVTGSANGSSGGGAAGIAPGVAVVRKAGAPGSGTTDRPAAPTEPGGTGGFPAGGVPVPGSATFEVTALRSPGLG